jgi:NAD(P)-dependent dehydrogenase (short-subunit alcohol dehydrogenase family)
MARVFITGSADGLGRAAAQTLRDDGHEIVVHVRNSDRITAVGDLVDGGAVAVVGDLSDLEETRGVADQVYLSSSMHRGGRAGLADMDWGGHRTTASYSDSKLFVTTLAAAVARIWPDVFSNAVDPGWVPTKMGGPGAPDDLRLGHRTQEWLATSDDPEARTSGGYWYHQSRAEPAPSVNDRQFQDQLVEHLGRFTATPLV